MDTINSRFDLIISSLYAGNKRSFANKIGVSPSVVENIVGTRGGKPSYDVVEKVCSNANISTEWLILGRGNMLISDQTTTVYTPPPMVVSAPVGTYKGDIVDSTEVTRHDNNKCSERLIDKQSVPLYDTYAAAGIVQIIQGDHSHIPTEYITIPRAPRCDGAMYVSGDSMYPILKSGDIVMYTEVHDIDLYLQWGEMYIVAYGHEGDDMMVVVKYIQKSDTPDMIRLVSHNQHHADKDIPKTAIRALGRVKASIRFQVM